MTDPYALPNGVLRNKLALTDPHELAAAEADITRARLTQLSASPLPGGYDLAHLQGFHARIFGDLYAWAGELRTVDIAKHTSFCRAAHLQTYANDVSGRLRSSNQLRGLQRKDFIHPPTGRVVRGSQRTAPLPRGKRPDTTGLPGPTQRGRRARTAVGRPRPGPQPGSVDQELQR